jgi:hypothetical protein
MRSPPRGGPPVVAPVLSGPLQGDEFDVVAVVQDRSVLDHDGLAAVPGDDLQAGGVFDVLADEADELFLHRTDRLLRL